MSDLAEICPSDPPPSTTANLYPTHIHHRILPSRQGFRALRPSGTKRRIQPSDDGHGTVAVTVTLTVIETSTVTEPLTDTITLKVMVTVRMTVTVKVYVEKKDKGENGGEGK